MTVGSSCSTITTVYEEEEESSEESGREYKPCTISDNENKKDRDEADEDRDSVSSSTSSVPDEDIDFSLVYALHTFVATLDGQTSVVKGDSMTLLDDTNSYWWLIRPLKTMEVGYIPAENIETPFERLARLNKHRNVEATLPAHLTENLKARQKITFGKKVKLSKELNCQLEVIWIDEEEGFGSPTYEHWTENMSDRSLAEQVSTENESEKVAESKSPIVNPYFNKSIEVKKDEVAKESKREEISKNNKRSFSPQKPPTGLKRLFSIGNKREKLFEEGNQQFHVLRIFAESISVGTMFATVAVTPETSADELLRLVLDKLHIPLLIDASSEHNGIEYYLTVKSMDGDELVLLPQDRPLEIFHSLSDHLTTPMPSMTYIRKLSIEQPTIKVTRVGVSKARQRAKAHFGEDSVIRFAIHKRIKRTVDGKTCIKIAYYCKEDQTQTEGGRKSNLLRKEAIPKGSKKERIDKLVGVHTSISISELVAISLEKFHLDPTENKLYYIALSINNAAEKILSENKILVEILNDINLVPKGSAEKVFVLRKRPCGSSSVIHQSMNQSGSFERHTLSNTDYVLRKLDEAIQSLELDTGKVRECTDLIKKTQMQSNKSSECDVGEYAKDQKMLQPRSTSLKSVGDVFDTLNNSFLSNMDDLELELHRIATSS
ncbi:hypothetical protein BY458DRAFT_499872 [Sporodiniella umbellata]|nr:hypothetical protein BY458DRAFT_499872 [Sporodiniella umbellata]